MEELITQFILDNFPILGSVGAIIYFVNKHIIKPQSRFYDEFIEFKHSVELSNQRTHYKIKRIQDDFDSFKDSIK